MILYARQKAWLSVKPTGAKYTRLESLQINNRPVILQEDDDDSNTITEESSEQLNKLEDKPQTLDIPLPDLPAGAEFLVSFFYDAGMCWQTGNGVVALPWSEIMSWAQCSDYIIERWQMMLVRRMSEAYCNQHYKSEDPKCPAPWLRKEAPKKQDAKEMDNILKSWLNSHKQKKR